MSDKSSPNKSQLLFDALCKANNSVPCTNLEAALGLLMFFDEITKNNPPMMPIVIGTWQKERLNGDEEVAAE